ncbi:FCD domain-containing protein [Xanthomonas theicola]|uniref:FCD domain-containing protein n=1 Tax=Xanthomonas theicola TaxID=56464 RepID=UPI001B7FFB14|nr:FCD domain-containing protein [Xanthomonas theicola]
MLLLDIPSHASKGLIESRPKAGSRVLPRSRWNLLDPETLGWAFAGQPNDTAFIGVLFERRAIAEPAAAALAAERRDKTRLKSLCDAIAGMTRHTFATEAGRTAERHFHSPILHATGNDTLILLKCEYLCRGQLDDAVQPSPACPGPAIPFRPSPRAPAAASNAMRCECWWNWRWRIRRSRCSRRPHRLCR